jgi:FkbM family methyltransferase
MQYFPNAQYFLVEAQQCHKPALAKLERDRTNLRSVLAAAGDKVGTIYFDAGNPFGGLASHTPFPANNIEVPVTTLDFEVSKNNLHGPFLIKFDTHGFEIPILKGAAQTLKQTSVIIMECYLHRLTEDSLLFHEICLYLNELGFRCIDMVDPVWRTYDDTFWQMDLVFIRKESPEFQYSQYE